MIGPKIRITSLLAPLLAILLLLTACVPAAGTAGPSAGQQPAAISAAQGPVPVQSTGIAVQGMGTASAAPDMVQVTLGVSVRASTVAEAQSDASARMNRVTERLTAMGVLKDQIRTVRYNIFPQYGQNQQLTGYQVENIVSARTKAIEKAGELLDAAAAAGANRVESISFTIADPKPLAVKARDEAMAEAKAKADQLARLAGVRLGRPTSISESVSGTPPPPIPFAAGRAEAVQATPISPGEMEVRVSVHVTYGIE